MQYGIMSPPKTGEFSFIEVSGRAYACPANDTIPVQEGDVSALKAQGWTLSKWVGTPFDLGGSAQLNWNRNGIVLLGDSRLDRYSYGGEAVGNSIIALRRRLDHFLTIANRILGQRLFCHGNFAYAGRRSDEYLGIDPANRAFETDKRGYASNVLAAKAQTAYWAMVFGIVNDVGAASTGTAMTVDYWNARVRPFAVEWLADGRGLILVTEPGSSAVGFTANRDKLDAVARYNAQLRQFARENPGNTVLFDLAKLMVDPASSGDNIAMRAGWTSDGTHIDQVAGGHIAGVAFAALMDPLVPKVDLLPYSGSEIRTSTGTGNQFFKNPCFTAATGGSAAGNANATGTIPLGVTAYSSQTTAGATNNALIPCVFGTTAGSYGNDLTMDFTATAAGWGRVDFDYGNTNIESIGDIFSALCEIDCTAQSNLQGVELMIEHNDGGLTHISSDGAVSSPTLHGVLGSGVTFTGHVLQTPDITIQPNNPSRGWLKIRLFVRFGAAGSASLKLRRLGLYRKQAA